MNFNSLGQRRFTAILCVLAALGGAIGCATDSGGESSGIVTTGSQQMDEILENTEADLQNVTAALDSLEASADPAATATTSPELEQSLAFYYDFLWEGMSDENREALTDYVTRAAAERGVPISQLANHVDEQMAADLTTDPALAAASEQMIAGLEFANSDPSGATEQAWPAFLIACIGPQAIACAGVVVGVVAIGVTVYAISTTETGGWDCLIDDGGNLFGWGAKCLVEICQQARRRPSNGVGCGLYTCRFKNTGSLVNNPGAYGPAYSRCSPPPPPPQQVFPPGTVIVIPPNAAPAR